MIATAFVTVAAAAVKRWKGKEGEDEEEDVEYVKLTVTGPRERTMTEEGKGKRLYKNSKRGLFVWSTFSS